MQSIGESATVQMFCLLATFIIINNYLIFEDLQVEQKAAQESIMMYMVGQKMIHAGNWSKKGLIYSPFNFKMYD